MSNHSKVKEIIQLNDEDTNMRLDYPDDDVTPRQDKYIKAIAEALSNEDFEILCDVLNKENGSSFNKQDITYEALQNGVFWQTLAEMDEVDNEEKIEAMVPDLIFSALSTGTNKGYFYVSIYSDNSIVINLPKVSDVKISPKDCFNKLPSRITFEKI